MQSGFKALKQPQILYETCRYVTVYIHKLNLNQQNYFDDTAYIFKLVHSDAKLNSPKLTVLCEKNCHYWCESKLPGEI